MSHGVLCSQGSAQRGTDEEGGGGICFLERNALVHCIKDTYRTRRGHTAMRALHPRATGIAENGASDARRGENEEADGDTVLAGAQPGCDSRAEFGRRRAQREAPVLDQPHGSSSGNDDLFLVRRRRVGMGGPRGDDAAEAARLDEVAG